MADSNTTTTHTLNTKAHLQDRPFYCNPSIRAQGVSFDYGGHEKTIIVLVVVVCWPRKTLTRYAFRSAQQTPPEWFMNEKRRGFDRAETNNFVGKSLTQCCMRGIDGNFWEENSGIFRFLGNWN